MTEARDQNPLDHNPFYLMATLHGEQCGPEIDADLWALLRWIIAGVGGAWRVEDLDATGRLYQLSVAAGA